jgi:WD40 repeat protein
MAQDLRIFISSPGDVTPERLIAKRVIDRLSREFAYHCHIEPILWERQPLIATEHFQAKITPPSKTDIVVVIIWSRLGSPLPHDQFPGPITGGEVTGTEWEFEDAVRSYQARKLPDLLLYRKQAPIMASLEDEAELERRRAQKHLVEQFVRRWFVDEQAGSFKAASHPFKDSVAFEDMLETHLRELISVRIGSASTSGLSIRWHQGSPFRGLDAFEVQHAQIFFGRARARNELREALARQSARGCAFVLVFGASGSGKSSLVKAGLLPDLMLPGMVENVGLCRVAIARPSDVSSDLFGGLSAALLRDASAAQVAALPELAQLEYDPRTLSRQLGDAAKASLPIRQGLQAARKTARLADHAHARLAIVVDQLEELFTYDFDNEDRIRFIATLAALAQSGHVWVIATMRSDFFDRLAALPELARLSQGEGRYLLTAPSDAEIGQIIVQPAREAGLRFEERSDGIPLDERLREEASKHPAALPLLEFALDQLWQHRVPETGMLTYEAYERLGGMEGALGRHAEEVFASQPAEVQEALPSVLRALTTVGQGEQAIATARTVPIANFPRDTAQRRMVEAFLAPRARLFVADGDGDGARVRIAHEALLKRWPRAASQVETDRKDLQTRTRLEQAMSRWQQAALADRASLLLAPGLPLSEGEEYVSRRRAELETGLTAYVDASIRANVAQTRRRKWIRMGVTSGALVLAAFTSVSWFQATFEKDRARAALRAAIISKLAVESLQILDGTGDRIQSQGLLVALAAFRLSGSPEALGALQYGLAKTPYLQRELLGSERIRAMALSPDGKRIVSGGDDNMLRLWDVSTGQLVGRPLSGHTDLISSVAFSPDGKRIVSGSRDTTLRLWNASDGQPIGPPLDGHGGEISSVAFNRDGNRIVSGSWDKTLRLWDAKTGKPIGEPLSGHMDWISSVAFSPDGNRIVSGSRDTTLRLWDAKTGKPIGEPLSGHMHLVWSIAFSPNGMQIVSGSEDKTLRLWDASGQPIGTPLSGHTKGVLSVAFSPDGKRIVSGSEDKTLRLWDASSRQPIGAPLTGHTNSISGVAFSPDGKQIVSGSEDKTLRLWDFSHSEPFGAPLSGHTDRVWSVALSPDGKRIVSGSWDKTLRLWDASSGQPIGEPLSGHPNRVWSVAFSPDGNRVVSGSGDKMLRLWDANSGQPIGALLTGHTQEVRSVAFSPVGNFIVSGSADNTLRLWDASTGQPIGAPLIGHTAGVTSVAVNLDGKRIVSGSNDKTLRLWDASSGQPIGAPLSGHIDAVRSVAFSPDGLSIASGGEDGTLRLWDVSKGQPIGRRAGGHTARVTSVAFSPDGKLLVSASVDNTLQLWDASNGQPIGTPLNGHTATVSSVAFSSDGKRIVSGSWDTTLRLWDGPAVWPRLACAKLTRNLSKAEWRQYAGELPYEMQCPDLPVSDDD